MHARSLKVVRKERMHFVDCFWCLLPHAFAKFWFSPVGQRLAGLHQQLLAGLVAGLVALAVGPVALVAGLAGLVAGPVAGHSQEELHLELHLELEWSGSLQP